MTEEYAKYLESDEWKKKRHARLALGKFKCAVCGAKSELQVHHLTYARIFQEDMTDLLPLCRPHHELAEKLIASGHLKRTDNPLFIAAETVRLLATNNGERQSKPTDTRPERKAQIKAELLSLSWFQEALKLPRNEFKRSLRVHLDEFGGRPRGRKWANAFALYDNAKNRKARKMEKQKRKIVSQSNLVSLIGEMAADDSIPPERCPF